MNKTVMILSLLIVIVLGACGVPLDEHNAQIQTANLTIETLKATGVASKARIKELEQIQTEFDALVEQQATLVVQATRSVESYLDKNMGIRNDYDRELRKCNDVLEEAVGTLVAWS